MTLRKLAAIAVILTSVCQTAYSADTAKKLCVNGSSQVFARPACLAAEKPFVAATTPTPTPTPAATGALNLTTCRRVAVTSASVVGVATAGFQCDLTKEFVLVYGFTTSDGFKSDASVRRQEIQYTSGGKLPVGVSVTMEGSRYPKELQSKSVGDLL